MSAHLGVERAGVTPILFEMLEPYDEKLSSAVLRGEWSREAPDLPDRQ
jgi:hypothetical protein